MSESFEPQEAGTPPSREGWMYKMTVASDVVVKRRVHLHPEGMFYTFHDFVNAPHAKKSWFLSPRCSLTPSSEARVSEPRKMKVRPQGAWTLSTKFLTHQAEPIDVYGFRISWPKRWAAKGYTSIDIGCDDVNDARDWYRAFATVIMELRGQAGEEGVTLDDVGKSISEFSRSMGGGPTPDKSVVSETMGQQANKRVPSAVREHVDEDKDPFGDIASSADGHVEDADDAEDVQPQLAQHENHRRWRSVTERWVPYRQMQGVAIYRLDGNSIKVENKAEAKLGNLGGEYMVSSIVRGPPQQVCDALMTGSSHTTILGPASSVEVLETTVGEDSQTKEVLRLVLEAQGWAGYLCAPREMLVERMLKEEDGMYIILFASVDNVVVPAGNAKEIRSTNSLYSKAVRGWVRGAYVVAPMLGYSLATSPEAMVTCIMKVDLGGGCGEKSLLHPLSSAAGLVDAFLAHMLGAVILVRDEVEHSRFVLAWQDLLMPEQEEEELLEPLSPLYFSEEGDAVGAAAGGSAEAGDGGGVSPGPMARSGTTSSRPATELRMQSKLSVRVRPGSSRMLGVGGLEGASSGGSSSARGGAASGRMSSMHLEDAVEEGAEIDFDRLRQMSTLPPSFWTELHAPGAPAVFDVRGGTYLKDRRKVNAGLSAFTLSSVDFFKLPHGKVEHVARFLPTVRQSGAPFAIVVNLIIPGNPLLNLVLTFVVDKHPRLLGTPPPNPLEDDQGWKPFDLVLHRCVWMGRGPTLTKGRPGLEAV
uniref:PH domain-containing protein n=1 Tax=Chlamydomonas euryale TaxID=1486919 RepID=A0A7R9VPK8_9CHLO|mmetsp:Transcript_41568/g.124277  ORF Transcript_41568/g.124277 Transcript_41568/m.124277 type:complete len:757 (+) Transcript_41568:339-2609(+)